MSAQKIGRYEVVRELGRGGMAVVYLAYDPYVKRQVAIKVLPRQFTFDPQFRARFQREAEIIAALEHAFIVPVHDFGGLDDQPYIVMRYMPGGSLLDRLRTGAMPLAEVSAIVTRLAEALDAAHAQGIVHRDIKPGNILFDARGESFLGDFGIAKISETTAALTGTGMIGTPEYMSPDQARGLKEIDGRSDVYSLGVVIYQALTGQLPYRADTPMSLALAHVTQPVPNIRTVKPDLPAGLETIVARAMAKEPKDRYPTAGELARDLARVVAQAEARLAPSAQATVYESYTVPPPQPTAPPPPIQPTAPPQVLQPPPPAPAPAARGGGGRTLAIAGGIGLAGILALGCCGVLIATNAIPIFPTQEPTRIVFVATDTPDPNPSDTPAPATPTPPPTATPPPTPEATVPAGAPVALPGDSWPVFLADTFDGDRDLWPLGSDSDEFASITRTIDGGRYVWTTTANQGVVSNARPDMEPIGNFYVAAEARQASGVEGGEYGLVLRHDGSNYYLFIVSEHREFAVFLRSGGSWNTLIDWTQTNLVNPGQVNRLAATADGPNFVLYINDQEVGRFSDNTIRAGEVGLALQLYNAGDQAVIEFDNFSLHEAWPVVLSETFDSAANGWPVGAYSDERVEAQRIIDGRYRVQTSALDGFVWRLDPDMADLGDFHTAVYARRARGPLDAPYGLSFRDDGSNYYYFKVSDDGYFRVSAYSGGAWQTVLDWQTTDLLRPGEYNRLAVRGEGPRLYFYINGRQVAETESALIASGTTGVAVELFNGGDEAEFEFDNFEVRAP